MNHSPLLSIQGLSKSFMGLQAVKDLSFQINPGEIVGLIGPNGAGKTTVFNLISRLYRADSGQILLNGDELTRLAPHDASMHGISRTFQNIRLFPRLSVLENILWTLGTRAGYGIVESMLRGARVRRQETQMLEEALNLLHGSGLYDERSEKAGSLPYGKQRRLELVRALSTRPCLLLLDEPTAGMNPTETHEFADYLKSVNDGGLTILVIEHDMPFVMDICERLVVLNHGAKIAEGSPEEIQRDETVITAYLGRSSNASDRKP